MGTRADFYIGRGEGAEWIGSIAWDGYPDGLSCDVLKANSESEFREAVQEMAHRDDWTSPEMGWPWPWEDSRTTDYAYAFDGDRVWASCFGYTWCDLAKAVEEERVMVDKLRAVEAGSPEAEALEDAHEALQERLWGGINSDDKTAVFPNMKDKQNVTLGKRSGITFIGRRA